MNTLDIVFICHKYEKDAFCNGVMSINCVGNIICPDLEIRLKENNSYFMEHEV